jgi:hypothetical protein
MHCRFGSGSGRNVDGWLLIGVCDTVGFWEGKMRLFLGVVSLLVSLSAAFAGPKEDALESDKCGGQGDVCGCEAGRGLADRAFSSIGNAAMKQPAHSRRI